MKRRWVALGVVAVAVLGAITFLHAYERGFMSSRDRVEREHGINLPSSARGFLCIGDALHGFLDRGATAIFEIDQSELSEFTEQFRRELNGDTRFVYGYGEAPEAWGKPKEKFRCFSSVGDWTVVAVFDVSPSTAGIKMYTDWN